MSESYEEKYAKWERLIAEANKELDILVELKRRYIEIHGLRDEEEDSFYDELLERIEEAVEKLHTPEPTIDEEFERRW